MTQQNNVAVLVYDVLGQVILKEVKSDVSATTFNLNICHVAKGVYFLKIETPEGEIVRRIVKGS
jgi:hypothetical protein